MKTTMSYEILMTTVKGPMNDLECFFKLFNHKIRVYVFE